MYKNLNDYEILYMVSENNDNFDVLIKKYKPLIYKIVKEYANTFKKFGYELNDLMQLGYVALYKSSNLYSVYSDSMFFSYLKKAVINAIITEMRRNKTMKREMLNNALSYDAEIPNSGYTYLELLPDNKKKDNSEVIWLITIFKNSLDFFTASVFELYFNGYKQNEIAILLDDAVDNIHKTICEIKKRALTYKYLFLS